MIRRPHAGAVIAWFLSVTLSTVGFAGGGDVDVTYDHGRFAPGAVSKSIGNEIVYQVVVDRFANGNRDNDSLYEGRYSSPDRSDWRRYWGGDLRGVIQRLPYLKRLGVTRLWITPIFENTLTAIEWQENGQRRECTSYHGYWIRDWFRLNPFFTDDGSTDFAIVDELIRAAAPEIRVILDSVANHTTPNDHVASWSLDMANRVVPLPAGDGVPRSHRGVLFEDGRYLTSWDEDLFRKRSQPGYWGFYRPECGINDWNNSWQVENCGLSGLPDFDQLNPAVDDYLMRAHEFWLERFPGLAGYRMDTIKHVSNDWWKSFSRRVVARHPNLEMIGEYFPGGATYSSSWPLYRETPMTMFDFSFRDALRDVFLGNAPFSRVTDVWGRDPVLGDATGLVTFLDNHDLPRLRSEGMTQQRSRQAIAVWLTSRGVPGIYYGTEQDLHHPAQTQDPYNRPMMDSFDENFPLFRLVQTINNLRRDNPALRWGVTHVIHQSTHILAYERLLDGHGVFVAVSKNPREGSDDFPLVGSRLPDGQYQDALSGRRYVIRGGRIDVSLRNGDIVLLSTTRRSSVRP